MTFRVSGRVLWSRKTLEESFYGKRAAMLRRDRCGCPCYLTCQVPLAHQKMTQTPNGSSVVASACDSWLMSWGCSETGYRQVTSTDTGHGPCVNYPFTVSSRGMIGC